MSALDELRLNIPDVDMDEEEDDAGNGEQAVPDQTAPQSCVFGCGLQNGDPDPSQPNSDEGL